MAKAIDATALDKVEGKLMTLVIVSEGDEYTVNIQMHAQVSGMQLMSAFKTAIHGLIGSAFEMGEGLGASREDVEEMLFPTAVEK